MKTYSYRDEPLKVFGIIDFEKHKTFQRIPEELIAKMESKDMPKVGSRCTGARIGFRTDSPSVRVKVKLKTLYKDLGCSIYSCQSVHVYAGDRPASRYLGLVNPPDYKTMEFSGTLKKDPVMEDVLLWLPRNELIENVEVSVEDEASVEPPTPYRYSLPVLYYGSSITEGGCPSTYPMSYAALLTRWLDADMYNLGFSSSARGELPMAEFIADVPMSVFVYDYDYNAPSAEHLRATHKPFFDVIRKKNPALPTIMMSRPVAQVTEDVLQRRQVILDTFQAAVDSGDKNVWFLDGTTFYGTEDRELCSTDTIHPNDLGFYRIAKTIEPLLRTILESSKTERRSKEKTERRPEEKTERRSKEKTERRSKEKLRDGPRKN